jgi:hypothetical protein
MMQYRQFSLRLLIAGFLIGLAGYAPVHAQEARLLRIPGHSQTRTAVAPRRLVKSLNVPAPAGTSGTASTVIFQEDFEGTSGFPPTGWVIVNADSGGTTGAWFQGTTSVFTADNGSGYAAANYQGANDFLIDQWLISPPIASIGSSDTLMFWQRSPDNSIYADSVEVRISTTDSLTTSFTTRLDYFQTSTSGWAQNKYPLKNFVTAGKTIRVAFRYLLYDAGSSGASSDYVGIDLVQIVRPQLTHDLTVASIDYPYTGTKQILAQSFQPQVTVKNVGSSSESSIPVRLQIIPPSGSTVIEDQTVTLISPGASAQVTFGTYVPAVTGQYSVKAMTILSTDQNTRNDTTTAIFMGSVLLSGTITVGAGGGAATLKNAVDSLNNNIISGDIELSLINTAYSEPPITIGPLDYSSVTRQVIIRPAAGISSTVTVTSTPAAAYGIAIRGTSDVMLDGLTGAPNTRNLTIVASGSYGETAVLVEGTGASNADSTTIRNVVLRTAADSLSSAAAYSGCLFSGYSSSYRNIGNRIANCDIGKFGATGIGAQWEEGLVIEKNSIHDWVQRGGSNDIAGILLADGCISPVVRGNSIVNIVSVVNHSAVTGIENGAGGGSGARVYNNFIAGIRSSGAGTSVNYSRGILASSTFNSGDGYFDNSIYLSGTDTSTSASSRSSGIEIAGGSDIACTGNIVENLMTINGAAAGNRAYGIYLSTLPGVFSSDYNDLYAPGIQGAVGYNSGNYATLPAWSLSFSVHLDTHSVSGDPFFVAPAAGNLHVRTDSLSPIAGRSTPVPEITTDIDGDTRNMSAPDIGADEFITGSVARTLDIPAGWALVSIPVIEADQHTASVFPSAVSAAFKYESHYIADTLLKAGKGYWLKFDAAQTLLWGGEPLKTDTITCTVGWNLVGTLTDSLAAAAVVQLPAGIVASQYYSYSNNAYTASGWLVPGRGYWVKLGQAGKLILSNP